MTKLIIGILIGAGIGFNVAALVEKEKNNGGGRWGW